MRFLPSLAAGNATWNLPLCDSVAQMLADALLADDAQVRFDRFAEALRSDSALTLWSLLRWAERGENRPSSIGELARWWNGSALDLLHWTTAPKARPAAESYEQWATTSALAVAIADEAFRIAEDCGNPEAAYLLGLVHNAEAWRQTACESGDSAETALPAWLAEHNGAVAEAVARVDEQTALKHPLAAEVADRWNRSARSEASRAGIVLQNLVARLRRLRDLETRFEETLLSEKLAALKELAYGASHEINNPLANISTRAQTLLRGETDPERRRKLATINSQAFRAHEMISDMMLFARPPEICREAIDLSGVVSDVVDELSATAAEQGTSLIFDAPSAPLVTMADGEQLRIAVKALVANAIEALSSGGRVEISLRQTTIDSSFGPVDRMEVTVADNGPGIDDEARRHLFDPFYSGREAGRGLGLGLSKCWRIVTAHDGRIEVESKLERGSTFTIQLPVVAWEVVESEAQVSRRPCPNFSPIG